MIGQNIGQSFGGYTVKGVLGEGAMGRVYLARQHALDRLVALKVMHSALSQDPAFRERFLRESRLAARVEHRNVLPVYDAGEVGGVLYIASRYVPGEDLAALLLREGRLSFDATVRIAEQIADGLDALHKHHLVHRDLKPGNVLMSGTEVLIADFGIAKPIGHPTLTATGGFIGTPVYAAPEQLRGDPVTPAVDLYALACVIFECLAGVRPFSRASALAEVQARLVEPPAALSTLRPDLPPPLDLVLARAMALDPADRYSSAGELVRAMQDSAVPAWMVPTVVVSVQGATAPIAGPKVAPSHRRRSLGIGLAVLSLVVVLTATGTTMNWSASSPSSAPSVIPPSESPSPTPTRNDRPDAVSVATFVQPDETLILKRVQSLDGSQPGHIILLTSRSGGRPFGVMGRLTVLGYSGATDTWRSIGGGSLNSDNVSPDLFVVQAMNDATWQVLLSTRAGSGGFLTYQLYALTSGRVQLLLERSGLFQGQVRAENGHLVEQRGGVSSAGEWNGKEYVWRLLPATPYDASTPGVVLNYSISASGIVSLPSAFSLRTGQVLTLVRVGGGPSGRVLSGRGVLESRGDSFVATKPGEAVITVMPGYEWDKAKELRVTVVP